MRAYYFGNMYLSSIQQGIQAAHVTAEMFVKYPPVEWEAAGSANQHLYDWAESHKTMILLNGGYGENLHELSSFFEGDIDMPGVERVSDHYDNYSPYPFAEFCEGDDALDGAITSVGIVLPPKIYDGAKEVRKLARNKRTHEYQMFWSSKTITLNGEAVYYNAWEIELMERIGKFSLAS